METRYTQYRPEEIRHPGYRLEYLLNQADIKKVDFAKRCGRPTKTISEIIAGKTIITPETALQFERVLGVEADAWLVLEMKYQLEIAKRKEREEVLTKDAKKWAQEFPVKEMYKKGFLETKPDKDNRVEILLRFFGVSNKDAWESYWDERINLAHFKQQQNHKINIFSVAAWLRQGEKLANEIETEQYDAIKFKETLVYIRSLTMHPWKEIEEDLKQTCKNVGVAVVFVPSLPNSGLRGAAYKEKDEGSYGSAFWGNKDKAVILLSDYSKSEERVWFTFFHEAAHILYHSKKTMFIDENKVGNADDKIESEANEFSAEFIISDKDFSEFKNKYHNNISGIKIADIKSFAEKIGISGGLLLEKLQHEKLLPYSFPSGNIKRRLEFNLED